VIERLVHVPSVSFARERIFQIKVGRCLRKRRGRCGRLGDRSPTGSAPRWVWPTG
jgi:hypothetical protein